jgi:vitamin B12 transporter
MALVFRRALAAPVFLAMFVPIAATAQSTIPEIVVTPYYSPTLLSRTGSSITVIPREQIARSSPASLSQVLRSIPGVTVIESGGPGATAEVRLRGAETGHTLVLIDGVRVNDFATARDDFDFSLISPHDIERIEILRGPQSAIYGSDAIGGVVNIVTRKGARDTHKGSASVEGGSYGTHAESASTSMSRGDMSLRLGGSHYFTRGFSRRGDRDANEPDSYEKWAGSFRAAYAPTDGPQAEVGLTGSMVHADYDAAGSSAAAANAANTVDKTLLSGFARLTWPNAGSGLEHSLMVFGAYSARDNIERAPPTPSIPESHFRSRSLGAEYKSVADIGHFGTLTLGGRIEHEAAENFAPSGGFSGFTGAKTLYALFAEDKIDLGDRLYLALSGRYDGEADGGGFLTGRTTAVYDLSEYGTRLKASAGTGAKRPTAYMLANNAFQAMSYGGVELNLRPEQSFGVDAGIEQTLHDGRIRLTATGFYNRYRDLLTTQTLNAPFDFAYVNLNRAMTAGLEATGEIDIVRGVLSIGGAYTYLHSEDAKGKPLARRPRHTGSVSVAFTPREEAEATLKAVYVGERFNSSGGTGVVLPAYWRVDLEASLALTPQTKVFARIENLLDARYQDPGGFNTPGLSAYLGLRWAN